MPTSLLNEIAKKGPKTIELAFADQPGDVHDRHEHREVVLDGEGGRDGLGGLHHVAVGISGEENCGCGIIATLSASHLPFQSDSRFAGHAHKCLTEWNTWVTLRMWYQVHCLSLFFTAFVYKGVLVSPVLPLKTPLEFSLELPTNNTHGHVVHPINIDP